MEGNNAKSLLFTPEGVRDIYGEDCEKRAKIQQGNFGTHYETVMDLRILKRLLLSSLIFLTETRGTVHSKEMFKFFDQYNNTLGAATGYYTVHCPLCG